MRKVMVLAPIAILFASDIYADSGVHFKRDSIEIELENQEKVVLANNSNMNSESRIIYSYRGFYQTIGYHKITWDGNESHGDFELINGKNGKRKSFSESEPILNELGWGIKYTPYIAVSKNSYHGASTLAIYTVKDSIQWIWDKILPNKNCWEFGKIIWNDTTSFLVEKAISKENGTRNSVLERVTMIKGKWVLEEKWKTDSSCKWILPKQGLKSNE